MSRLPVFLSLSLLVACEDDRVSPRADSGVSEGAGHVATEGARSKPLAKIDANAVAEEAACLARIGDVVRQEPLPGDLAFDGQRAQLLVRGKGNPAVFVSPPPFTGSPRAERIRETIETAPIPARALYDVYPTLTREPALAREVLLRDGYLYTELPSLAGALSSVVRLNHLFQDDEVWIHRGERIVRAERRRIEDQWTYVYADGPDRGESAQILFLDRVSADEAALRLPLHRDLVPISRELGFDRASVRHVMQDFLVADLRYGSTWVPSLLETSGATVRLSCEAVPPASAGEVLGFRARAQRLGRILSALRAVIEQQVDEDLPFDEPKTEVGQQDGKLRQEWLWAYRFGRSHFDFNEDRYAVFDGRGRPRVPQVCIDFIRDTYERMSGSWYRPRGEPRVRIPGRLNFREQDIENERSVESFVTFAEQNPTAFEVLHLTDDERVQFMKRKEFYGFLFERRDDFRIGDVVTIYGLRDDEKMHYHSFFIYEADPVTGMPTLVAANAGRPRIRPWDVEMASAPKRSIKSRIRPRLEWLESIAEPARLPMQAAAPPI